MSSKKRTYGNLTFNNYAQKSKDEKIPLYSNHGGPQKFLQGRANFFDEISVKQRFYSTSLTFFNFV